MDKPGGADATSWFAARDIVPVTLEVKRPYAACSKTLGFYLYDRYASGVVSAKPLSLTRASEFRKM